MKAILLALLGISVLAAGCGSHNSLTGKWSEAETGSDGAVQTTTYQFLSDGLATVEAKTSKGSLLKINGGGLFGGSVPKPADPKAAPDGGNPLAAAFGALLPTVARVNVKGTYTVKDDVLTLKVADVSMYDPQNQPVSLSNETHDSQQIIKFKVDGDKLTLDKLDGTPPTVYVRQKS
ncbi:MAG: DUF1627 domain-containing protein [Armatimonadota bacterium]|nr:DUF1627 domain-containing protein [Armatimonadota bacterium]